MFSDQAEGLVFLIVLDSTLPPTIAHFHSLVPLVHNTHKNVAMFGYSTWAYKAVSIQDGKAYCLRRLQGTLLRLVRCDLLIAQQATT